MSGREHDAAGRAMFADHADHRWRGQQAALANEHLGVAVGRCHAQDDLDRCAVVVAAIAAGHQGFAGDMAERVEPALHEVFEVMRLLEDGDLLAQAGGAGTLAGNRLGVSWTVWWQRSKSSYKTHRALHTRKECEALDTA